MRATSRRGERPPPKKNMRRKSFRSSCNTKKSYLGISFVSGFSCPYIAVCNVLADVTFFFNVRTQTVLLIVVPCVCCGTQMCALMGGNSVVCRALPPDTQNKYTKPVQVALYTEQALMGGVPWYARLLVEHKNINNHRTVVS